MILDGKERERRKEKEEVGARVSDRLTKTGICRERVYVRQIRDREIDR